MSKVASVKMLEKKIKVMSDKELELLDLIIFGERKERFENKNKHIVNVDVEPGNVVNEWLFKLSNKQLLEMYNDIQKLNDRDMEEKWGIELAGTTREDFDELLDDLYIILKERSLI